MKVIFTKAPVLAWLLTALACFVTGMAVVEASHQAFAYPALTPAEVVVTVEVGVPPTATPEPTTQPTETRTSPPTAWPTGGAISPRPEDCVVMVCTYAGTPAPTEDDLSPSSGTSGRVP